MKITTTLLTGLIFVSTLVSCKKEDTANPEDGQRPDLVYNLNAEKLVALVNEIRVKGCDCGTETMYPTAPVKWSNTLAEAAYTHSADMNTNNFFDHQGSDGMYVNTRVERKGYSWAMVGENLARGQETEEEVVNSWLQSPKHCVNMLNSNFKEMGAARSGNYWTQVLAVTK